MFGFFLTEEDVFYENEIAISQGLSREIEEINMMIDDFSLQGLPKVKRFGLPFFSQDNLKQHFAYINGLFSLNVEKRPQIAL